MENTSVFCPLINGHCRDDCSMFSPSGEFGTCDVVTLACIAVAHLKWIDAELEDLARAIVKYTGYTPPYRGAKEVNGEVTL